MNDNRLETGNNCIDLLKFFASIMIFAMHCQAFLDFGRFSFLWELLTRWGVPFFFVASAYFLFSKQTNSYFSKTVKKYILRIAILYSVWFCVNIPSIFITRLYSKDMASVKTWLIFLKNSVLSSTFTGSWYLVSCMFCAFSISILGKYLKTCTIIFFSLFVQLLCVFTSVYGGVLPYVIRRVLSFLCFPLNIFGGMLYFAIGKWIAENKEYLICKNRDAYFLFFVFAYFLYFLEIIVSKKIGIYKSSDQAFSLAPLCFFLFVITLQSSIKLRGAKLLRKASTIIYCAQSNILIFNSALKKLLHINSSLFRFALSLIVMMIIITVILVLQQRKKTRWAQYFT